MLSSTRRGFLSRLGPGVAFGLMSRPTASAACLQTDTIRWIVGHAPGGGYDTYSRLVEPYLERELGVSIYVDNIPGAGGLKGAATLTEAPPNGATLGILNMAGLLMASLTTNLPFDQLNDFTMLGTINKSSHIWATGASTGLKSIEELLQLGRTRGVVFGVNTFNSLGFLLPALTSAMLGCKADYVSGYGGSTQTVMAAIRGEVDVVSASWDVVSNRVHAGDLRPLALMSADLAKADPVLRGAPVLAGKHGLIAEASPKTAGDAEALVRLMNVGRVIVAPAGMDPTLEKCLSDAACRALHDPKLVEAAAARRYRVQPICAEETQRRVQAAQADLPALAPIAREAIARAQA